MLMKAKNSNLELNYNLNEGKHKKTLLEKYLNHWNGEERVNGAVNLERDDFVNELVENSENKFNESVVNEYKEFLENFGRSNTTEDYLELENIIRSKSPEDLSNESFSKLIKKFT
jgi:hypothetical protein